MCDGVPEGQHASLTDRAGEIRTPLSANELNEH